MSPKLRARSRQDPNGHELAVERRIRFVDELELDAGVVEFDGELVELSLVSNSQGDGEGALRQVARGRFTGSVDELSSLSS